MNTLAPLLADRSDIPVWGWKGWVMFALAVLFVWFAVRFKRIRTWWHDVLAESWVGPRGRLTEAPAVDRAPAIALKCRQRGHFYRANRDNRRWECQRDGCEESHPMATTVPASVRRTS